MCRSNMSLLLPVLIVVMSMGVQSQDSTLSTTLASLIETKKRMATEMISMKGNVDNGDSLKKFINTLKNLQQRADEFMKSPLESLQPTAAQNVLKNVIDKSESNYNTSDPLMASFTLAHNNERRAWSLLTKISQHIQQSLPLDIHFICKDVKYTKDPIDHHPLSDLKTISVQNVCHDVESCPKNKTLYSNKEKEFQSESLANSTVGKMKQKKNSTFISNIVQTMMEHLSRMAYLAQEKLRKEERKRQFKEQDVSVACTRDNQCNVQQALPMMTGVLRFQINEMIYQRLCPKNCGVGTCNYLGTYKTVEEDIERLIGFAASLPFYWALTWKTFFQNAVAARAFSNIDVALSMVEENKNDFEIANFQCYMLRFTKYCPIVDLFKQFRIFKKMQQNMNNDVKVKDLRLYSQMNYAEMMKLQAEDLRQIELLGSIKMLDDNLQASVAGISKYFEGLAKFDEGIAAADVGFIKGELDKYEKSLIAVETQLHKDISEAMTLMVVVVGANLAEEVGKLAALIAENSNPLKLIFAGPDVMDVLEQSGVVANAASELVRGTALIVSIKELAEDSLKLRAAFGMNSQQITSLQSVVDKIRNGQSNNIGRDADKFIEEYGAYTPQTDRASLAKNDALWSAFKDSMCELLYGDVGIGGSVPKSIAGGKLICERLEGTLTQFFTLREDIFDFQFQLVDGIAVVVRGNIAQRFARDINVKYDLMDASQLMTGFFLMQYKIQKISSVYCDVLEYKQLGKPISSCAKVNGLFKEDSMKALISYADNTPYYEVERNVYIPTRAETQGDTGVIDLQALARGEKVVFKIPVDQRWLLKYRWLLPEETFIPFLKSLKVILPLKTYSKGAAQRLLTTHITITSIAGSSVSTVNPNTGVVYILPKAQNTYLTIYEEGDSSCTTEIDNPYSLCNNLPKICDKTRRISEQSLLPTILSTFSLQVSIHQGLQKEDYDAPSPQTRLLVRAQAVLKIPLNNSKKKSHILDLAPSSDVALSNNGCCKDNRYRSSLYDRSCEVCPQDTTSYHGGLFCQINETLTK